MMRNKKITKITKRTVSFFILATLTILTGCGGGSNSGGEKINVISESAFTISPVPESAIAILPIPPIPETPPFPAIVSSGNTYHVNKDTGNNSNNGSSSNPWETIQYGINQLVPGDTLIIHEVKDGYDEWVTVPNTGFDNNWITIKGADQEKVVISGGRITFNSTASYVLFKNIDIDVPDASYMLMDIKTNSSNLVLDDITIDCNNSTANYTGIWVRGGVNNAWFKNIDIHNCGYLKTNPTDAGGIQLGIDSEPLLNNIIFMNVTMRDNKGDGINGWHVDKIYFDGCTASKNTGDGLDIYAHTHSVIRNTVSSENGNDQGNGFKIWSKEAWIVNSLTYSNDYSGVLYIPKWDDSNIYILNSTFAGDGGGEFYDMNKYGATEVGTNNVYLYNNIFFTAHINNVAFENTLKQTLAGEDNNYYFSMDQSTATVAVKLIEEVPGNQVVTAYSYSQIEDGAWFAATGHGGHDIGKVKSDNLPDPGFTDLNNNDYSLKQGSLAIDAGTNVGLTKDIIETSVPQGGAPDIGAYEKY